MFGLGTFADLPFYPWGAYSDFGYRRNQNMTPDKATWLNAVNGMTIYSGNDGPESQYIALHQAATGAGLEIPPADGDYADWGEISPGLNPSLRPDAVKVFAITTDASFHTPGDSACYSPSPCPFPYPGPSRDADGQRAQRRRNHSHRHQGAWLRLSDG